MRRYAKTLITMLTTICLLSCTWCCASESRKTSVDNENAAVSSLKRIHSIVSRVDGKRCPMYPSCSKYGFDAIRKYGFVRGWFMTCDRLLRCGRDEIALSPAIIINGKKYCHDPLSQNEMED